MTIRSKLGAVLLALACLALPAAAANATVSHHSTPWGLIVSLGLLVGGAVVTTYSSFAADNPTPQVGTPYTGGTTPPTATQSSNVNRVNALISCTDADTTVYLTHNMALSAAQAAANEPDLIVAYTAVQTSNTVPSPFTWSVANTNVAVGTKAANTGSGCTISITARRPASPGN